MFTCIKSFAWMLIDIFLCSDLLEIHVINITVSFLCIQHSIVIVPSPFFGASSNSRDRKFTLSKPKFQILQFYNFHLLWVVRDS